MAEEWLAHRLDNSHPDLHADHIAKQLVRRLNLLHKGPAVSSSAVDRPPSSREVFPTAVCEEGQPVGHVSALACHCRQEPTDPHQVWRHAAWWQAKTAEWHRLAAMAQALDYGSRIRDRGLAGTTKAAGSRSVDGSHATGRCLRDRTTSPITAPIPNDSSVCAGRSARTSLQLSTRGAAVRRPVAHLPRVSAPPSRERTIPTCVESPSACWPDANQHCPD